MKIIYCIFVLLGTLFLFGCQRDASQSEKNSREARSTSAILLLDDQARLAELLKQSEVADKRRSLVHVSHTCTITIGDEDFAVVDMRELIKGATTARGVNQIILLNSENQLVNQIEYGNSRPLFCEGNKLYLHGDVIPDGQTEAGNVLVFTDSGFSVSVIKEDLNAKLLVR